MSGLGDCLSACIIVISLRLLSFILLIKNSAGRETWASQLHVGRRSFVRSVVQWPQRYKK